MSNNYFRFKEFTIIQEKSAFRVGTDGVLLGAYADVTGVKNILDIGTGTGLIAIMLAQRSSADIVALEPDHESFTEATGNVSLSPWKNRIKVEECTLQEYSPVHGVFDLIVTNPPYFIDSLKNPEPRTAAARHNATLTTADLLKGVSLLMSDYGRFQVILPYVEGTIFIAEAQQYGLYCNNILKIRPLPTSEVKRLILTFSRTRQKATERFLTIEYGRRHEFTEEYKNLTRDFYLRF